MCKSKNKLCFIWFLHSFDANIYDSNIVLEIR